MEEGYEEMFPAPRDARRAGVIMHPTSLPGNYGIGDMGTEVGSARAHTHTQIHKQDHTKTNCMSHKLFAPSSRLTDPAAVGGLKIERRPGYVTQPSTHS